MSDPIVVTVTDPKSGEVLETRTLDNDFMVLCAGNRYVKGVQSYPFTGTQVVTVAIDRESQDVGNESGASS